MLKYSKLITPETPWEHVLNTGQGRVAGKTGRLGSLGMLGGQIPTTTTVNSNRVVRA